MRFSLLDNNNPGPHQHLVARRMRKKQKVFLHPRPLLLTANVGRFRTQESSSSRSAVKAELRSEATEQPIQVNVTVNLSVPSTILCNLSTETMETTIRFGLADSIQTSVAHGIQAVLISKILEEASAVSAGGTATEEISPDKKLPHQHSEDEETLKASVKPEEEFTTLLTTGNTPVTLYFEEHQVSVSSPPQTQLSPSEYESESEQGDSITSSSSDPVQIHVSDASSFSSSSDTYRNTPSFHIPTASHVPIDFLPSPAATLPPDTQEIDTTELSSSTILPMHHLPSGKRKISAPESTLASRAIIQVHLHDDPDSPLKNVETWHVKPHSKNIFKQELWDAGYRWCSNSNDSVSFVSQYQVFSWEILEPFTVKEGRETKALFLYRRPTGRLGFLLGTGIGFLLHLVSLILFMWQPWRSDFAGSSHAFFSNFLPMVAQWWMRVELKRPGERIIDPYLNSIYKLNPRNLLY